MCVCVILCIITHNVFLYVCMGVRVCVNSDCGRGKTNFIAEAVPLTPTNE